MKQTDDSTIDAQLVARITAGETEQLGQLMARYEPKLLRYVVYLIHDEAVARDVVQETFIKTYQNLKGYNAKYKFSSWIYRIAHNEAINAVKRNAREIHIDADDEMATNSTTIRDIDRKILAGDVGECLDELGSRYREVLMLYYYENMKYEDIADVVHAPRSTVGVWMARAKRQLKVICEKRGVIR